MAYAQITTNRDTQRKESRLLYFKQGAVKIVKGGLVGIAPTTGYLAHMAGVASMVFQGVAYDTADNSDALHGFSGVAGGAGVRVERDGVHLLKMASGAQTDIGKEVYVALGTSADNATVTTSAPANYACKVGRIVEIESTTEVWVDITGYAGVTVGAAT